MIKVIAFDLVGVLVHENDTVLSEVEDKLERLLGDNISDIEYIDKANGVVNNEDVEKTIKEVFYKLYDVQDKDIFKKIKEISPDVKTLVATNNVSFVKYYIYDVFDRKYLDDIIVSADIHMIKPNPGFYNYILDKYKIKPNEMLFLDDNIRNIDGAKNLGIEAINVNENMDLYLEVIKVINKGEKS